MKHIIMLIVLIGLLSVLQAQKTIETIDLSFDNPIVTRVVITVDKEAEWTYSINKPNHQVKVTIFNCDVGNPIVNGLNKNYLVTNMDMQSTMRNAELLITLDGSFLIENSTLKDPFRIVLDLFKYTKSASFQDLLYEATFYAKVGKWAKAEKTFAQIVREHPQNLDVYYYWGQMLIDQGKKENAIEKLNAVPQGSKLFKSAQSILAQLEGNTSSVADEISLDTIVNDNLEVNTETESIGEIPLKTGTIQNDFNFFSIKNYVDFKRYKPFFIKMTTLLKDLPIWFWVILIVVILIIILVVFDILRFKKHSGSSKTRVKMRADNPVKEELVKKLLIDGWKEKEIARELLLTPKEAAIYIKRVKKYEAK